MANALGVDSSYLIDLCKKEDSVNPYSKEENKQLINLICNSIGIAMGIAVVILNILNKLEIKDAITILGIGLACISTSLLSKNIDEEKSKTIIRKR